MLHSLNNVAYCIKSKFVTRFSARQTENKNPSFFTFFTSFLSFVLVSYLSRTVIQLVAWKKEKFGLSCGTIFIYLIRFTRLRTRSPRIASRPLFCLVSFWLGAFYGLLFSCSFLFLGTSTAFTKGFNRVQSTILLYKTLLAYYPSLFSFVINIFDRRNKMIK